MVYQLYNIVDIEATSLSKTFKSLVIIFTVIVEAINIFAYIKSIGTGTISFWQFLFTIVMYCVCAYIITLQINGDRKDIVLLNITLEDNKIILTYPNRELRRRAEPYVIEIGWNNIIDLNYIEEKGVFEITYFEEEFVEEKEVIYLQENNKKQISKDIIKYYEDFMKKC